MYILENDDISTIREGFRQVFENKFTINIGLKEIIKMRNNGAITDRDLKITKLLFKFRFATLDQIYEHLEIINTEDDMAAKMNIKNRLDKLVKYHVINKFNLTMNPSIDVIQPEAMDFYCLDLGGRHLLSHYSNKDVADWYTVENMKASEVILKDLKALSFYISLMKSCPAKVVYFNLREDMKIGKKNFEPDFVFLLEINGVKNYFIGEIVLDSDFPMMIRERLFKLDELFSTNTWKKYFYDAQVPPVLLFITDNDDLALSVADMTIETTELDRFRVSTGERMTKPLYDLGAFLKYEEKGKPLTEIRAGSFLP